MIRTSACIFCGQQGGGHTLTGYIGQRKQYSVFRKLDDVKIVATYFAERLIQAAIS
jgi:hypothetical protein